MAADPPADPPAVPILLILLILLILPILLIRLIRSRPCPRLPSPVTRRPAVLCFVPSRRLEASRRAGACRFLTSPRASGSDRKQ